MIEGLHMDPATHTYTHNGIVRLSVTQILTKAGVIDTRWFDEASRWRGSVVHRITQLDDLGELHKYDWPEEARGYVEAWRKAKRELGFVPYPDGIEKLVFNEEWLYPGTLDRLGKRHKRQTLIDLKTGAIADWVRMQLAGYAACLDDPFGTDRIAVRLQSNGKYKCKPYSVADYARDRDEFLRHLRDVREAELCQV